jgi:hypothetical protein
MSRVSHFRDLDVWQGGMDLVESVYQSTVMGKQLYVLRNALEKRL